MSLPDELELIHFDDEILQVNKRESQKELKKQGKRAKGGHSKKNSSSSIGVGEPSQATQTRRQGRRRNRDKGSYTRLWETFYCDKEDGATDNSIECIRGFLLKRRKFPLKGFHKRFFVLQNGFLLYGRSQAQLEKGKCLGQLDMGYSVISMQAERLRIDIDAGDQSFVYHIKAWDANHFAAWSSRLHQHSMYRRRQLSEGMALPHIQHGQEQVDINHISPVSNWITSSKEGLEEMKKAIESVQEGLESLSVYVAGNDVAEMISQRSDHPSISEVQTHRPITPSRSASDVSTQPQGHATMDTPNKKKRFAKLRIRGGGKTSDRPKSPMTSHEVMTGHQLLDHTSELSRSWSNLSEPKMESTIVYDDFAVAAHQVYSQLVDLVNSLEKERESLKDVLEREAAMQVQQKIMMAGLKLSLNKSQVQNTELREALAKIRSIATIGDSVLVPEISLSMNRSQRGTSLLSKQPSSLHTSLNRFESFMSIPSSYSATGERYFDAPDEFMLPGGESSEESQNTESDEEDDEDDENESDGEERSSQIPYLSTSPHHSLSSALATTNYSSHSLTDVHTSPVVDATSMEDHAPQQSAVTIPNRRKILPSPEVASGDLGLWSILRKNIGRDLSKVSMPVSLNEPLGALQRLCEELHYSTLLDKAVTCADPCDRMVYVAAFAVSGYASFAHRAKHKPFNPILGETYECIREERGFKYISEQISHHPPVAACHCESPNFVFWQDARIKNKFWGKSMEVFPLGTVNLVLPQHNEHYTWNKATACIHNILSGQRWLENYGEVLIQNGTKCCCKLVFSRARYWSSKRHEVTGTVYNEEGQPVRNLFGNWTEMLFCGCSDDKECIWRADTMPDYADSYYGFTQYTIELNELTDTLSDQLPACDTRFRPDQRLLEEGKLDEAQAEKLRLEQLQREAKSDREKLHMEWTPNFFKREVKDDNETWTYLGNYWIQRERKFRDIAIPKLW